MGASVVVAVGTGVARLGACHIVSGTLFALCGGEAVLDLSSAQHQRNHNAV